MTGSNLPDDLEAELLRILDTLSDAELEERRKSWQPVAHSYTTGALAKYTRLVTSAAQGAVTS